MPNAKDAELSSTESVLALGEIGNGKTSQFLTLPGRKFMYCFDPGALRAIQGYDIEYEEFVADAMDLDISVHSLAKSVTPDRSRVRKKIEPVTYIKWEEDFETRLSNGYFKDFQWLGFDSMTTFSDIIMDRVQYLNGRLGKQPEQGDWSAQMTTIRNVMRAAHGAGLGIYTCAHIDMRQDEVSKRITNQIMLTGRLRTQLPLLFTQVLLFLSDSDMKGRQFLMQTAPDRENPKIRTNFKDVAFKEDVTIDWKKDPIGQGLGKFLSQTRGK
jgi:hypothetical protein